MSYSPSVMDGYRSALYDIYHPRYKHDCSSCKSLGQFQDWDLYFCPQDGKPTVVARCSDDGPDYISGLDFQYPALIEAQHRAEYVGLLPHDK